MARSRSLLAFALVVFAINAGAAKLFPRFGIGGGIANRRLTAIIPGNYDLVPNQGYVGLIDLLMPMTQSFPRVFGLDVDTSVNFGNSSGPDSDSVSWTDSNLELSEYYQDYQEGIKIGYGVSYHPFTSLKGSGNKSYLTMDLLTSWGTFAYFEYFPARNPKISLQIKYENVEYRAPGGASAYFGSLIISEVFALTIDDPLAQKHRQESVKP